MYKLHSQRLHLRQDSRLGDCASCMRRENLTKFQFTISPPFLVKDFVYTQVGKVKSLSLFLRLLHFPESMCKTPRLWCRLRSLRPLVVALFAQEGIGHSREEAVNDLSSRNRLNMREWQRKALHIIKCSLNKVIQKLNCLSHMECFLSYLCVSLLCVRLQRCRLTPCMHYSWIPTPLSGSRLLS